MEALVAAVAAAVACAQGLAAACGATAQIHYAPKQAQAIEKVRHMGLWCVAAQTHRPHPAAGLNPPRSPPVGFQLFLSRIKVKYALSRILATPLAADGVINPFT
jgi:hypothetical protein